MGCLIAFKLLARVDDTRPQVLSDLQTLTKVALPDDLAQPRTAINLITKRGFDRGRNLMTAFEAMTSVKSD